MSWKSLVTAGLLCVLASPVFAAPGLNITGGVNNKAATPVRVWNVAASPDLALSAAGTPLALELGFQATGGNILSISATPNMATAAAPAAARVDYDTNTGTQIFSWQTTTDVGGGVMKYVGTGFSANQAYAYLGTNIFTTAGNRDLLTITTDASVTALAWGGAYNANGTIIAPVASLGAGIGRISQLDTTNLCGQASCNFQEAGYAGTLNKLTAGKYFLGDMNGSGTVTNADVTPFGDALNAGGVLYKTNRPNLNYLRADINGSGTVTNADVSRFGEILNGIIAGSGAGLEGGAVPEPASCLLASLAVMFAASIRRRS